MARTAAPDHIDAYVGARIGLRRSALGLSQAALAQRIGVSFQQVQKYETGLNRISASRLHRVAVVLRSPVDAFFPPIDGHPSGEIDVLRTLSATVDGRTVANDFPRIADRAVRQAVARIVAALAPAS
ncbi:helix-turn-helix transcriptional regulator [Brevundimonas sp.]|jgi:transcriptional regulator with XRE-family HTH domain|uniref:helix-turn-helix domain-containing protein n=1 Tax=Brevundimonas sp. TaxID=1871086 RepID=UPI0025C071C6|nr:helix-turn-helix transcriptional regulator [Brevundimonas sp.]